MSSNTPNPFGGPPLDVNPNYGTQPARPWTDRPSTIVVPSKPKDTTKKGGKSKRKSKRRRSRRR